MPATINGMGAPMAETLPDAPPGTEPIPLFAELLRSQISAQFSANAEVSQTSDDVARAGEAALTGEDVQPGAASAIPGDALAAIMPMLLAQIAAQQGQPVPPGVAPRVEGGGGRAANAPGYPIATTEAAATPAEGAALPAGGGAPAAAQAATISPQPANVATEDTARAPAEPPRHGVDNNSPFQTALNSAQGLPTAAPAAPAREATNLPPEVRMNTPFGATHWDREVGDTVTWMVNRQESHAALVLNPPQLGRIEVSVSLNGDQANALFVSQNPAVRDALEAALPRLRETLAEAGITLGQSQVGSDAPSPRGEERRDNPDPRAVTPEAVDGILAATAPSAIPQRISSGRGMVDTFA